MSSTYWRQQGACRAVDPDLFFPDGYRSGAHQAQVRQAAAVCHSCPVTAECLAQTMRREGNQSAGAREGVAGGLDPFQRRALYERTIAPHDNAHVERAAVEVAERFGARIVRHRTEGLEWGQVATRVRRPTEVVRRAYALVISGQVVPAPERAVRTELAA